MAVLRESLAIDLDGAAQFVEPGQLLEVVVVRAVGRVDLVVRRSSRPGRARRRGSRERHAGREVTDSASVDADRQAGRRAVHAERGRGVRDCRTWRARAVRSGSWSGSCGRADRACSWSPVRPVVPVEVRYAVLEVTRPLASNSVASVWTMLLVPELCRCLRDSCRSCLCGEQKRDRACRNRCARSCREALRCGSVAPSRRRRKLVESKLVPEVPAPEDGVTKYSRSSATRPPASKTGVVSA